MSHRSRTSYDFYRDQLAEDKLQDLPDLPLTCRETPMGIVRPPSPMMIPTGHEPRPWSRARLPTTVRSYTDVGLQAADARMELNENPYLSPMDPVNRHYYYRQWHRNPPRLQRPIAREGRLGSPWRHIKTCINNAGNHLVFIDGNVKSDENFFYPPVVTDDLRSFPIHISPPRRLFAAVPPATSRNPKDTIFNQRARQGFKYWPHEQKPIDYSAKYSFGARNCCLGLPGPSFSSYKGQVPGPVIHIYNP